MCCWRLIAAGFLSLAIFGHAADLKWRDGAGFRSAVLTVGGGAKAGFTELPSASTGIHFTNLLGQDRSLTNQIYLNGAGVAAGDVDGDGRPDLYFCGLDSSNALFRNLGGWRFENITERAGVACADQASTGTALVDVDGDRDLDLLVNGIARGTRLFLNDGTGKFSERTDAGFDQRPGSMSMAIADVEGDGDLDVYVVNYRSTTLRDAPDTRFRLSPTPGGLKVSAVNGRPTTSPELIGRYSVDRDSGILEHGEPDCLYLNDGTGRFAPVSWTDGAFLDDAGKPIAAPYDWGLSAMFRDMNGDGAPDLYVCNDFEAEDRIWMNDGAGKFRAIAASAIRHTSRYSMGVDFADLDRDGRDDFFVADMLSQDLGRRKVQLADRKMTPAKTFRVEERPQYAHNTLFWNRGSGLYSEIAFMAGVEASEWSWCPVFLDADLDGYDDLFITTGHERDAQNIDITRKLEAIKKENPLPPLERLRLRKLFPALAVPNVAFKNEGALRFSSAGSKWGFSSTQISHGLITADLDADGDLDLVASCLNAPPLIYRNEASAARVAIRLRGARGNSSGIGARIHFEADGLPAQAQEMIAAGRYLSSDESLRAFAMGAAKSAMVRVQWSDGRESVAQVEANRIYELSEEGAGKPQRPALREKQPWFSKVTVPSPLVHVDAPFNDWELQPLLPRGLSDAGPAVLVRDFNGDDWPDIMVSAGRGGSLIIATNSGGTNFTPMAHAFAKPVTRDQTAVVGLSDRGMKLAVAHSNYEDGLAHGAAVRLLDLEKGKTEEALVNFPASVGAIAAGDPDGDGDMDLFVGARVLPRKYPAAADSVFLRNNNGAFERDTHVNRAFAGLGLATAATWADLDGDRRPELVVACEWGPIRVFKWAGEKVEELTAAMGLNDRLGLWTSVAAGDFDGDGRMDIVAGNYGRNNTYHAFIKPELRLYHYDEENDGIVEVIEAAQAGKGSEWFPLRDLDRLKVGIPRLGEIFATCSAFSEAPLGKALGPAKTNFLRVNSLDSTIFLNREGKFVAQALPLDAQVSTVNSISAGDLNKDGKMDVLLTQNFASVHPDDTRQDAGFSLILLGNGDGTFRALLPEESGLRVMGDARGAAIADINKDGWPDLVIGENNGPLHIYRNRLAEASGAAK